jgi:hypothetical protein
MSLLASKPEPLQSCDRDAWNSRARACARVRQPRQSRRLWSARRECAIACRAAPRAQPRPRGASTVRARLLRPPLQERACPCQGVDAADGRSDLPALAAACKRECKRECRRPRTSGSRRPPTGSGRGGECAQRGDRGDARGPADGARMLPRHCAPARSTSLDLVDRSRVPLAPPPASLAAGLSARPSPLAVRSRAPTRSPPSMMPPTVRSALPNGRASLRCATSSPLPAVRSR